MIAESLLCAVRLSRRDSVDDSRVLLDDGLHLAFDGQIQPTEPIDMSGLSPHEIPEISNASGVVHRPMERQVGVVECLMFTQFSKCSLLPDQAA